jgi:hypothetical protein
LNQEYYELTIDTMQNIVLINTFQSVRVFIYKFLCKINVDGNVHIHVDATFLCRCCIFMSILHVHDHAACSCRCYMSMSKLHFHVDAACPNFLSMLHIHVSKMHVHVECPCYMSMLHDLAVCPCCMWWPIKCETGTDKAVAR